MKKRDIVRELQKREKLSYQEAALAVDVFFDTFRQLLRDEGVIRFYRFGAFWIDDDNRRTEPQRVKFRPSPRLRHPHLV